MSNPWVQPDPTWPMWVELGRVGFMWWVGLGWIFFDPPWWVGSKNLLNPTQPDPCTPFNPTQPDPCTPLSRTPWVLVLHTLMANFILYYLPKKERDELYIIPPQKKKKKRLKARKYSRKVDALFPIIHY